VKSHKYYIFWVCFSSLSYPACKPHARYYIVIYDPSRSRGQLKCDGTRAETRFRLSAKRTNPFKSAGASVQSTAGSRDVSIRGSNAGYTMFRGSVKSTGYPLHSPVSPSLPHSWVTVCHYISIGVYSMFAHCLIKDIIFRRKKKEMVDMKRVFWFCLQLLFEPILILRINQRDKTTNLHRSSCKIYSLFFMFTGPCIIVIVEE